VFLNKNISVWKTIPTFVNGIFKTLFFNKFYSILPVHNLSIDISKPNLQISKNNFSTPLTPHHQHHILFKKTYKYYSKKDLGQSCLQIPKFNSECTSIRNCTYLFAANEPVNCTGWCLRAYENGLLCLQEM
jgi:hypothetical protein